MRTILAALAGFLVAVDADAPALAQCATTNISAADGQSSDGFGTDVAIDGDILAVGVPGDDDVGGSAQGSVRVFRWSTSGWGTPTTILATDGFVGDAFGTSVSVYGRWLVVGAPGRDAPLSGQGAVYVFELQGSTWTQVARLLASNPAANDQFGVAVSVHGTRLVAGAPAADPGGLSSRGAAYVFKYDGATWVQEQILVASDGAAADTFGEDVDIWGDRVIVGSDGASPGGVSSMGAAYIFNRASGAWVEEGKLLPSDGGASDLFGDSVAIDDATAAVGAYGHNNAAGADQGAVYTYRFSSSTSLWEQSAKVTSPTAAANEEFGSCVDIRGALMIVGASADDLAGITGTNHGSAHLYRTPRVPVLISSFNDPAAASGDTFGSSVAVSAQFAAIGVPNDDPASVVNAGSAWVLDVDKIEPVLGTIAVVDSAATTDSDNSLGASTAINGFGDFVFGAPLADVDGVADAGRFVAYLRGANGLRAPVVTTSPTPVTNGFFGMAMTVGNFLTVSEPGTSKVYSYTHNSTGFNTPTTFTGPTGISWGNQLSESGSVLLVGATGGNSGRGEVYAYSRSSNWVQEAVLQSPDGSLAANFGQAVWIDGSTAVIGDDQIADGATSLEGAAYVFTRTGTTWTLQQKLTLPGANLSGANFGRWVCVDGDRVVIASDMSSTQSALHVFERTGTTWAHVQTIDQVGPGSVAALDGDTMAVGYVASSSFQQVIVLYRRFSGTWLPSPSVFRPLPTSTNSRLSISLRGTSAILGLVSPSLSSSGERVMVGIPECTARLDNLATGESFTSVSTATAAAERGDTINANLFATMGSFSTVDQDLTVAVRGGLRQSRGSTWTIGDNAAVTSSTTLSVSNELFGATTVNNFRAASILCGFTPLETGASSSISVASGSALLVSTFDAMRLKGAISIQAGGVLVLQPEEERFLPRALENHGSIVTRGVLSVAGSASVRQLTNAADGTITGNGDLVGNVLNEGRLTAQADMQLDGTLTNSGLITIQNGTLSVFGTVTNTGTIVGSCPSCLLGGPALFSAADIALGADASLLMGSNATLTAGGAFDCAVNSNTRFDLSNSMLETFTTNPGQTLEVMSRDIGPDVAGLDRTRTGHYPIGRLSINSRGSTVLVDAHDNDGLGQGGCEAIYVDELVINPGSRLVNPSCRIYYTTLINQGTVDVPANLISLVPECPADFNNDGGVDSDDVIAFFGDWDNGNIAADFNRDGGVDSDDVIGFFSRWDAGC